MVPKYKPVVILKYINGRYVRVMAKRLIKEVSRWAEQRTMLD